ncbi:unnamed protein product [Soboliphyme baturini]|uniref:ENTH domain-containing protein n=1 Tax=Soboliphyme baturini TaxID=241478 RepID=A0A183IYR8_9BILA|nr:unnamed protein product [Soboliphyme baturini]
MFIGSCATFYDLCRARVVAQETTHTYDMPPSEEAQHKFGGAKSISSDQFFGGGSTDFEARQNLSRFEASSAISSSDFFNEEPKSHSTKTASRYSVPSLNVQLPDLIDIKESVRSGVATVANKLSTLSTNVSSYISVSYVRLFQIDFDS